jgi:hypothetical protein
MNALPEGLLKGTFGELLVQLRLLQHSVQAAPPVKDTGNDLIAIRGTVFRAVQVRTRCSFPVDVKKRKLPKQYHVLAIVVLGKVDYDDLVDYEVALDMCRVFLLKKEEVIKRYFTEQDLQQYDLSKQRIDQLWSRVSENGVIQRKRT